MLSFALGSRSSDSRSENSAQISRRATAIALVFSLLALLPAGAAPLQGKVQQEGSAPLSGDLSADSDHTLLPAGVGFSDTVPPVSSTLKLHKLFSSLTLPAEDRDDTWYHIPSWRAGMFHREKQIDHTIFGDVESVSKVDHLYGMQVDKKGGIWHHMSWPRITKIALDGYSQYKIIDKYEPVNTSPAEFCIKITSTNIDVDDKTGKITRLARQEEFDRYFPVSGGLARGYCLIKGFSMFGRVNTTIEKVSVEESMTKPFTPLNSFRGTNLRESFIRYLKSHDLGDLAPDEEKTSN